MTVTRRQCLQMGTMGVTITMGDNLLLHLLILTFYLASTPQTATAQEEKTQSTHQLATVTRSKLFTNI